MALKTGVLMSPADGFNLPGSLMKPESGFAVPKKLQSIRKGDRERLRIQAVFSFLPAFLTINGRAEKQKQLKQQLLEAIEPLERGVTATPDDQLRIDQLARKVEAFNPTKEPLKSDLTNGKWELIYTTSAAILQAKKPKFLRSITNYQSINVDTLKVQRMETWPFYNSVTGDLSPLNSKKAAVKLQVFKILGFIPVKAPDTARGELEITLCGRGTKDIKRWQRQVVVYIEDVRSHLSNPSLIEKKWFRTIIHTYIPYIACDSVSLFDRVCNLIREDKKTSFCQCFQLVLLIDIALY